jgi:hypothetical protein
MVELATMVIDLTGSHSRIVHRPRPKDGPVRTITYFDELLSDQKLRARLITEPSA